ncbi:MAG: hypothetical protein R8M38_02425 [Mariprofundaceae bacterium]
MKKAAQSIVVTLLVLGYPVLVYLAITNGISWVVPLIVGIIFFRRFLAGGESAPMFALIALLLFIGAIFFQNLSAKMIPVFIHSSLFLVFYGSLRTDSSLIERFARLDFPVLPPGIADYCRKVTWVWSAFFALNVILCTALAIWADDALWAFYNGGIIYLLLGVMMVAEYIWRRIRYPWLEIPPLKQSMMNIIKNGHIVWNNK